MISFKIGKLPVQISFWFIALLTVFFAAGNPDGSLAALLVCLIHELGHLIMFFLLKQTPTLLSFELSGIRLNQPNRSLSFSKELLILLSGSGLNFLLFFIFIKSVGDFSALSIFAAAHLVVGIFNLLPLRNFDGGKIVQLILSRFLKDFTAQKICGLLDAVCLLLLLAGSMILTSVYPNSFTLLIVSLFLTLSFLCRVFGPVKRKKR